MVCVEPRLDYTGIIAIMLYLCTTSREFYLSVAKQQECGYSEYTCTGTQVVQYRVTVQTGQHNVRCEGVITEVRLLGGGGHHLLTTTSIKLELTAG